jgi:hypothetical protein
VGDGAQTFVRTGAAGSPPPADSAQTPPGEDGAGACPTCAKALVGDYCHHCGEKRSGARDLSLRHFVADAAQELTSLDSKLFRTLFTLLVRPGRLTNEWIAGRRVPYIKPLNLCLGIFALSLFVYTASKNVNIFDIRFMIENEPEYAKQMGLRGGGHVYADMFAEVARRRGVPAESLYDTFNEKWQRNFSLLGPAQIVALAVLLQLVYFFSRRYFVEHLVFSMHFLAWAALTNTLLWPVYYFTGLHLSGVNAYLAGFKFLADIAYLFLALRAVYRGHPALVVLGAVVVFVGYFFIYSFMAVAALFAALVSIMFG